MKRLFWAAVLSVAGVAPAFAQAQIASSHYYKTASHGQRAKIASFMAVDISCHTAGETRINLVRPPQDGAVETSLGGDYPTFPQQNPRFACNRRRVPSTFIFYHANPSSTFDGVDTFDVEVVYPSGTARKFRYAVVVH